MPFAWVRAASLLLALLCALELRALDPGRALTQYVQTVWRMEGGLPHNTVRAVVQTRDGYLWLGTYAGLARFDGVRFVVFDTRNSKLRHNEIRALAEDREGAIWIGTTAGGLHRLANGVIEPWDGGIGQRTVNALRVAPDGTLWVGTGGGLYAVRNGSAVRYAEDQGLASPFVNAIAVDGEAIWIGTARGVYRLERGRASQVAPPPYDADEIPSVHLGRDGHLWIGTRNLAVESAWDGRQLNEVRALVLPGVWGWIHTFLDDADGNLWIGSYGGGLFRWSGGRIERMSVAEGLLDHRPWALFEDAERSLWLGTRGGLGRLRDGAATTIATQEGLPGEIARTVFEDRDGAIWIGSEGGLSVLRGGVLRNVGGLPVEIVRTIVRDREGRLWIGGDGGVARLDDTGRVTERIAPERFPSSRARILLFDRRGRTWVGTERGLIYAPEGLAGGAVRLPPGLEDLGGDAIEALYEDRAGGIWVGTLTNGMRRWHEGRVENPRLLEGASVGVRSFHEDPDGTMWVGTVGSGLFVRTPGGAFRRVTTREGLPDDAIWSILPAGGKGEPDEIYWMSSDRGVFAIRRSSILEVIEGRAKGVRVERVIGLPDGMKSAECNGGGAPAGIIARDGRIWVPTSRGAAAIDPRRVSTNRRPPPVIIEEVVIDRRVVPHDDELEVPAGSRDVEVHYTALSFVNRSRIRFRYRLEGHDESWVDTGSRRVAYFSSLRPGKYLLRVQAANADGVWNFTGARMAVTVRPRVDETTWFRALVTLLLVGAVVGWLHWRTGRQWAREQELRRLVAERTIELQRANAQLERLAAIDDLTGIANHRTFAATLESEWARCRREEEPLSLLLGDVDDFKAYNDTYGHPAGDEVLRRVAQSITAVLPRATDLAARYGGEEFAAVLPFTDAAGARQVAERIRAAVESLAIPHRGSRAAPCLTISVGCATVTPHTGGELNDLIASADRALYAAKAEGRNRVR